METKLVNNSNHVRFDEGMNDLEISTPNTKHIWIDLGRTLLEYQEEAPIIIPPTLDSQQIPLPMINDVPFRIVFEHDTLGVILGYFPYRYRIYVKDIIPRISCSKIKIWKNKFRSGVHCKNIKYPSC